jgi:Ca-activated chloride channel family protein
MASYSFIKKFCLLATMFLAPCLSPALVTRSQAPLSEDNASSLLLILDASGSMNSDDGSGQSKIAAAKQALYQVVDSLPEGSQVGLRVYGHRASNSEKDRAAGCRDTELISPVQPLSRRAMKDSIGRTRRFTFHCAAVDFRPDTGARSSY